MLENNPISLTEEALASMVSERYLKLPVKQLPSSFHFWAYDESRRKFCDIYAGSAFDGWTTSEVIRSLSAVPHIYQPLKKAGHTYSDALLAPKVRKLFKKTSTEK